MEIEPVEMKALHELDEWHPWFSGREALELLDAYHDDRVMAAHAHTLRPLLTGTPNHFAQPRLGILEFPPAGLRRPAFFAVVTSARLAMFPIPGQLVRYLA